MFFNGDVTVALYCGLELFYVMPRASVTGVSFWPRRPRESRNLTSKHFALTSGYRVVRRRSIGCLPTGDGGSFLRSLLLVLIYAAPCAHERCDPCAFLLVRRSFVELISLMVRFSMFFCAHFFTKLSGSHGISIHMVACATLLSIESHLGPCVPFGI